MTDPTSALERPDSRWREVTTWLPYVVTGVLFVALFLRPAILLGRDWWNDPEAGHGLLLAPAAFYLAWKRGRVTGSEGNIWLGLVIVLGAVLLRVASELAAELFMMRFSMVMAAGGLVVFWLGLKQAVAWWLPFTLLVLSIPLPELIRSTLALPLQLQASDLGTSLLEWRQIPVRMAGNVIMLPGHKLFVTEACSGLRSLTALLSLALLMGGLWLRLPAMRVLLIAAAIPVAILINGVRVFLTGFLVYYVDPKLGEGFMHMTEGWLLFGVSLVTTAIVAALLVSLERAWTARKAAA